MYKKRDARAKFLFCLVKLLLFFFTFSSPLHLKLPIIYDTLWSVRNKIFSVQIELLLLVASETFIDSSVLSSFLVREAWWTNGQLRRENSRRIRTHEKNSRETVCWLGTIIQSIFCVQSGASIRLNVWKWSGESRCPGAFRPVLENFRRAFSLDPSDRPWVSEDGSCPDLCCDWSYQNKRNRNITSVHGFASLTGKGKRSHLRLKNVAPEPYSKQGLWLAGQTIGMVT